MMKTFSFVKIFMKNIRKCETIETQSKAKAVEEKNGFFLYFLLQVLIYCSKNIFGAKMVVKKTSEHATIKSATRNFFFKIFRAERKLLCGSLLTLDHCLTWHWQCRSAKLLPFLRINFTRCESQTS